jgi:hypothetical protein
MNRWSKQLCWSAALLVLLALTALPQTKPRSRRATPRAKPVTVTLVRWPYT